MGLYHVLYLVSCTYVVMPRVIIMTHGGKDEAEDLRYTDSIYRLNRIPHHHTQFLEGRCRYVRCLGAEDVE